MSTAHDAPALTPEATAAHRRHVQEAAAFVRERVERVPALALVLGTGEGTRPQALTVDEEWSFEEIPHVPTSEHDGGTLAVCHLAETPVAVLEGPLSLHGGYTARQVAFPIRMLGEIGIDTVLFTNAAGSVHPEVAPSDLFLVTDHINFQGMNPLVGPNVEEWGPRFPDMTESYDPELRQRAEAVALREGISLQKGIYFATLGPNLGTQAEYRMVRTLGADVVGTDTVPEVIAARHMDLRVLTISVIADRCSPDAVAPVSTGELTEAVETARPKLRRLLGEIAADVDAETEPA
jgi:purine-nucleoside phosphorylase